MHKHEQRSLLRQPYLVARLEPSTRYDSGWRNTTDSRAPGVFYEKPKSLHLVRPGSVSVCSYVGAPLREYACQHMCTHWHPTTCDDQHLDTCITRLQKSTSRMARSSYCSLDLSNTCEIALIQKAAVKSIVSLPQQKLVAGLESSDYECMSQCRGLNSICMHNDHLNNSEWNSK